MALYAPSKTFNLAGLVGSYHIIYNQWMRERVEKEASLCHYNDMNVLSMHALLGAYKPEGYVWVDELRQVLTGNIEFACDYIAAHFPGVQVSKPQGTYMLFLDCTQWCAAHGKTIEEVLKAGWDAGVMAGWPHVPWPMSYPHEFSVAFIPSAGSFARLQQFVFC